VRFAIFSDIHDNARGLTRTLADAEQQGADRLICLGDVGRTPALFEELQRRNVACLCGNWEVSGFRRLPDALRTWVGAWPATRRQGQVIVCHATPDMDADDTTETIAANLAQRGGWMAVFPRLHRNEQAVWNALAVLEEQNARAAFHGHTHVQHVWAWQADGHERRRLRAFSEPTDFGLEPGPANAPSRYLIGVGSAGEPQDGAQLRYALYDDATGIVTLRRLDP